MYTNRLALIPKARLRRWLGGGIELTALLLVAMTGVRLEAAGSNSRSATMAARIDAPRAPSICLASGPRRPERCNGCQTLGAAPGNRSASLLGLATDWPATDAILSDLHRPAPLPASVSSRPYPTDLGQRARFVTGPLALKASIGRGRRAGASLPETLAGNTHTRHAPSGAIGLLRADDLVGTEGASFAALGATPASGAKAAGLLSPSSALTTESSRDSLQPWSVPTPRAVEALHLAR